MIKAVFEYNDESLLSRENINPDNYLYMVAAGIAWAQKINVSDITIRFKEEN